MTFFYYILSLLLGLLIIRSRGSKRLVLYYTAIMLVPSGFNVLPYSFIAGNMFFLFMFLISMFWHRELKFKIFNSPFNGPILFLFISYLLIGLLDTRVGPILGSYRGLIAFLGSYSLFYIGWVSLKSYDDDYFIKTIIPITIIVTLYGIFTGIFKINPISDYFYPPDPYHVSDYSDNFRGFRVTGFMHSCSVYGMFCFFLFLLGYSSIKGKTRLFKGAVLLLLLNLFLTATRAAIIPSLVGITVFLLCYKGLSKTFKIFLSSLLIILVFLLIMPSSITDYFYQLFDSIVDVVSPSGTGGEKYGGSNVDARQMQIATAFYEYLPERPLFGHGFAYNQEVMGGVKDEQLLGMESYLCFLGVEYGLVNIIAVLAFYISMLIYFIRGFRYDRLNASIGLAFLIMFILFLIFAWVGDNWYYSMPMFGYVAKRLYLSKAYSSCK